jgi:hypothetical protein
MKSFRNTEKASFQAAYAPKVQIKKVEKTGANPK